MFPDITNVISCAVLVSWDRSACLVLTKPLGRKQDKFCDLGKEEKNSQGSFRYHTVLLLLLFLQGITRRLLCTPRSHTVVEFVSCHRKVKWRGGVCVSMGWLIHKKTVQLTRPNLCFIYVAFLIIHTCMLSVHTHALPVELTGASTQT